jgi:hypothetical protein
MSSSQDVEPYYESPALRRAASANSTPRKLRALKRLVDDEIGSDTSTELYRFADDWTVRFVESLTDRRRDGWLMKCCLRGARLPKAKSFLSLRDSDGMPHMLFHVWSIVDADAEVIDAFEWEHGPPFPSSGTFLLVRTELVGVNGTARGNSSPKAAHVDRLREFAEQARLDDPGVTIGAFVLTPWPIPRFSFSAALNHTIFGASARASAQSRGEEFLFL